MSLIFAIIRSLERLVDQTIEWTTEMAGRIPCG